ncbi:RNA polymerase sigma factor SigZ [Vibrio sp. 10N.261.55.A7]|uniref:RNA polymerase sigma factor SigZ n=1 Tax=Vibrio sp. 10N.261.55.A7 TaxID=1880851 RepID=UPI000C81555A|nr:RNA polymerase sigma factor SigZ [Vibrio sp. 10N.261.55.A7]PMJ88293.1 RNA polymerase sigma factor SigZ [Vibrio sp. 10N.261.55.A7]
MNIDTIWSEYRNSLKGFLHKNVANHDDVDDLLQEVLIKTYNKLDTIKDKSKLKSWLFQIANNTIIDFYRKSKPHSELQDETVWQSEPEAVMEELSDCVVPFIQGLPEEHAALLTAIEIEGIPQKEYAENNGIKYSTLKSRVQKSRQLLHGLFSECCEFSVDAQGNVLDYHQKPTPCSKC